MSHGRYRRLVKLGMVCAICGSFVLGFAGIESTRTHSIAQETKAKPRSGASAAGAANSSHGNETGQHLDLGQVARSYRASLKALRNMPLRIKSEAVPLSAAGGPTISQTLLVYRGNVRLEDAVATNGIVEVRSETSIVNDHYLMAIMDKARPGVLLTSFVHAPNDRFNRVVSRFYGADYLGFPVVIWRGKSHDILEVLPTLKPSGRHETRDGMDTVLLEGTSEDVALKLWIAPSLNYWPTRIEWRPAVPERLTDENIGRIPAYALHDCEFRQSMAQVHGKRLAQAGGQTRPVASGTPRTHSLQAFSRNKRPAPSRNRSGLDQRNQATKSVFGGPQLA